MKKIFIIIILSIIFSLTESYGQDSIDWKKVPSVVRKNFFISLKRIDYLDSLNKINEKIIVKCEDENAQADSIIKSETERIKILEQQKAELISEIGNQVEPQIETKRFMTWEGFYTSIGTGYFFGDSLGTFTKSLTQNIFLEGRAIIKIGDNFMLSPALEFPLNRDKKISVRVEFGYRWF